MMGFTVADLTAATGGTPTRAAEAFLTRRLSGVSTDSRAELKGRAFVAIRGERFDGTRFIPDAFRGGALCALVNRDRNQNGLSGFPIIGVDDTIKALGDAARTYRSRFTGKVITVTGSTGKTTTKEMLLAVLARKWRVHGTRGNFNNRIGLPLSVFGLEATHDIGVFEIGMNAKGEIAELSRIAAPSIGVLLNAGRAHMEYFSSVEEVADAKLELLEGLDPAGLLVVNADDHNLSVGASRFGGRIMRFGIEREADIRAANIAIDDRGCASFEVEGRRVVLAVPGRHMVYNALAAWTVGAAMGISPTQMAASLGTFASPDKRLQVFIRDGVTWINDAYNANPVSLAAALDVLKTVAVPAGGRRIAVLGDMLELGAIAEDEHEAAGERAAAAADLLFAVGEQAALYREGAVAAGMDPARIMIFPDADAAGRVVNETVKPGDAVLVKGSRRLQMERVLGESGDI